MTIHNLSRRVAITGICAAVAVPVTIKAGADPVYAAIKAYQDGYAHHAACLERANAIEEVFFTEWRKLDARLENSVATDMAPEFDRLLSSIQTTQPSLTKEQLLEILRYKGREMIRDENGGEEADRLRDEGSAAECDARDALFATVPTTAAGAADLLALIRKDVAEGTTMADIFGDSDADKLFASLEASLRALA